MTKQALKYVGQSVPRVDGIEKVTGKAKFLGDLVIPGMLHGKIFRSPYPHARILSVDASKAEALPGVAAVLTAADTGDLVPTYNGRPVIAMNKVRYVGEPVAAVAATGGGDLAYRRAIRRASRRGRNRRGPRSGRVIDSRGPQRQHLQPRACGARQRARGLRSVRCDRGGPFHFSNGLSLRDGASRGHRALE